MRDFPVIKNLPANAGDVRDVGLIPGLGRSPGEGIRVPTLVFLGFPWGFPGGAEVKASACNAGDLGLIPGSGRSPGEGNDKPLQYSCLENPMDRGAWWATVHGLQRVGQD